MKTAPHQYHQVESALAAPELRSQGCEQDRKNLHCWHIERPTWQAELCLEVEELTVRYIQVSEVGRDIQRSFKYSLSRRDVEAAVFSGP